MQFTATVTGAPQVDTKSGIAKASGKPYSMREQKVVMTLPNGNLRSTVLSLEQDEQPLPEGTYTPKPEAFGFGAFDVPTISTRARHWQRVDAAKK